MINFNWPSSTFDYEAEDDDEEIREVQEYRSSLRKTRYRILPHLLQILQNCPNQSNLCDLAHRYDRFKRGRIDTSTDSNTSNVLMSQTGSHINPYLQQSKLVATRKQTLTNYWDLMETSKSSNLVVQDVLTGLHEALKNHQEKLASLTQENQQTRLQIMNYFSYQLDDTSSSPLRVDEHNYKTQLRQQHILTRQREEVPLLLHRKEQLFVQTKEQEQEIEQLEARIASRLQDQTLESLQEQIKDEEQYQQQLSLGLQQLSRQLAQIKEKIDYMELEKQRMQNLQQSDLIDQFLRKFQLPVAELRDFSNLLARSVFFPRPSIRFEKDMLNFESFAISNPGLGELSQIEAEFAEKNLSLKRQYESKMQDIQLEKQKKHQQYEELTAKLDAYGDVLDRWEKLQTTMKDTKAKLAEIGEKEDKLNFELRLLEEMSKKLGS